MRTAPKNSCPSLSVIIPVFRDDTALADLLSRLGTFGIERIYVVDGEGRLSPPQNILRLLSEYPCAHWSQAPRGRGPQIAHGIGQALEHGCETLWVLHADAVPHAFAPIEIMRVLARPTTALGMFRLSFDRRRWAYWLFESFARLDSALTSFGDQGFFFRRKDIAALWPQLKTELENAPILEDMILRRALKSRGNVKKSPLKIGSSPRRFERYGLWSTQIRNMLILIRAYRGTPPAQLYDSYYDPAPLLPRDTAEHPPTAPISS